MDLKIYHGFEECPVGGWYEAHGLAGYKATEEHYVLFHEKTSAAILSLLSLAQDGEKWREMYGERPQAAEPLPPLPSDARNLDATIREVGAEVVKELRIIRDEVKRVSLNVDTIRLRGAR